MIWSSSFDELPVHEPSETNWKVLMKPNILTTRILDSLLRKNMNLTYCDLGWSA
jgi:hypothetical protein